MLSHKGRGSALPLPRYRAKASTQTDQMIVPDSIFKERVNPDAVIPGWSAGPDPESRDSGFDASHRPGMTESGLVRGACHRARIRATRWLAMMVWTASLKRHLVPKRGRRSATEGSRP